MNPFIKEREMTDTFLATSAPPGDVFVQNASSNWNLTGNDPFPSSLPQSVHDRLTEYQTKTGRAFGMFSKPQNKGRFRRRQCWKAITLFGLLSNLFSLSFEKIYWSTVIIIGTTWGYYVDEHLRRLFQYQTDSFTEAWNGLAFPVTVTVVIGVVIILATTLYNLYERSISPPHRRRNRTTYRRYIKLARDRDPVIPDRDMDYDRFVFKKQPTLRLTVSTATRTRSCPTFI